MWDLVENPEDRLSRDAAYSSAKIDQKLEEKKYQNIIKVPLCGNQFTAVAILMIKHHKIFWR